MSQHGPSGVEFPVLDLRAVVSAGGSVLEIRPLSGARALIGLVLAGLAVVIVGLMVSTGTFERGTVILATIFSVGSVICGVRRELAVDRRQGVVVGSVGFASPLVRRPLRSRRVALERCDRVVLTSSLVVRLSCPGEGDLVVAHGKHGDSLRRLAEIIADFLGVPCEDRSARLGRPSPAQAALTGLRGEGEQGGDEPQRLRGE